MNTPAMTFEQEMGKAWNRMVSLSATLKTLRALSNPVAPPVIVNAMQKLLTRLVWCGL